MAYKLVIKPLAENDLMDSLAYCKSQSAGLDSRLFNEITEVLADIILNPKHFQERYRDIRIRYTKKFKYGIHYTIEENVIFVHAIFHTSRKPRK